MRRSKNSFRHESLQDAESIQQILRSITKGIAKGRVVLSDEDGDIVMEPDGLLHLKVTGEQDESRHRLNIRISWQIEEKVKAKKLSVR